MKWKLFSKKTIRNRIQFLWMNENGDKIERRTGQSGIDYALQTQNGAIYDLEARTLSEAKTEVKQFLNV